MVVLNNEHLMSPLKKYKFIFFIMPVKHAPHYGPSPSKRALRPYRPSLYFLPISWALRTYGPLYILFSFIYNIRPYSVYLSV